MSNWEHHANISLQCLSEALQRGQLDRDEYRQRRRRILAAGHDRQALTRRNAVTAPHTAAPGASPARRRSTPALVWASILGAVALLAWLWAWALT